MNACYIHVPFCRDICSYCDFTRCRYHTGLVTKWLHVIQREISNSLRDYSLETIYVGGGTPSVLANVELETLLACLKPFTSSVTEYTIEANIDSLTNEKLRIMNNYGVNRISLGVQTLQEHLLTLIQRKSTRQDALDVIQAIHQHGIQNISIDLIYGLPEQTLEQWKQDIVDIVDNFDINHISLYSLTIEEHSKFGRDGVKAAEEGLEADMFEFAMCYLQQHGYEHYEISNFAKSGMRSKHNQVYWEYEDFLGIGCGASGKINHKRYENTCNLQTYFEQGSSPVYTPLTKEDEMFETIMMGLRTSDGVSLCLFKELYDVDLIKYYEHVLRVEINKGMLQISNGYLKATKQGMMLLNDVLVKFLQ